MKLQKIKLHNFRPFYNTTNWFSFSHGDKNVTIIHCENGIGKTTLLNAFTWCLFSCLSEDVEEPEELVNKRALREAAIGDIIDCWVDLYFDHDSKKYRMKRTKKIKKIEEPDKWVDVNSGSEVLLQFSEGGKWDDIEDYTDTIGRILPQELHNYFFFNAERIEWIQRPKNKKQFTSAVTLLIGDEVYSRAIRHLNGAKGKLEEEQRLIGDAETKHLYEEKAKLESELIDVKNKINDHDNNIEGYKKQQEKYSKELLTIGGEITKLERERISCKEELKTLDELVQNNRTTILDILTTKGYLAFSKNAVDVFLGIVQELREKGQIPSPYKANFVKQLLDSGICICGRELVKGDAPFEEVLKWLEKASISEVQDIAIKMEAHMETMRTEIPLLFMDLDREQSERANLIIKQADLQEKVERIGEMIDNSKVEKAQEIENLLKDIKDKIEEIILQKGEDIRRHKDLEKEIAKKEEEIAKKEAKSEQEKLVKNQIKACKQAIEEITKRQNIIRQDYKRDLERRINSIFNAISFKPYVVKMSEDYSLSLFDENSTVGKSTSENQILSLSFIVALMQQAKEYTASKDLRPLDSSVYPLVMDSPFGSLGKIYQAKVAGLVPRLANQLIILVSPTQWSSHVEVSLSQKIGSEYVITYNSTKPDIEEVNVHINGKAYPLIKKYVGLEDYIEIQEVKRHG